MSEFGRQDTVLSIRVELYRPRGLTVTVNRGECFGHYAYPDGQDILADAKAIGFLVEDAMKRFSDQSRPPQL